MYICLIIRYLKVIITESKLKCIFSEVEDYRSDINKLHNLTDILLIGVVSIICGAEKWKQMLEFAKSKETFLRKFLSLPNGIPSDDTINRVFSGIDSEQCEDCFRRWVNSLTLSHTGTVINFDGKTLNGAKSNGKKSPIHIW